jgi:hypothetical protein
VVSSVFFVFFGSYLIWDRKFDFLKSVVTSLGLTLEVHGKLGRLSVNS